MNDEKNVKILLCFTGIISAIFVIFFIIFFLLCIDYNLNENISVSINSNPPRFESRGVKNLCQTDS